MAIIGRLACPWCGFEAAHVKRNEPKLPYHHCPGCGMMTPAKNGHQAGLMTGRMRPVDGPPEPIIAPGLVAPPTAAPTPPPAPAPRQRKADFWTDLSGKVTA